MKRTAGILLIIICFFILTGYAQVKPKLRKSIRAEFQLPKATSNPAFKKTFSGVFNTGLSMNFGGKHFNAGGFYSFTQYQIFPKFFEDPHSILANHTAGIKLTYDLFTSTRSGIFSPFIAPGYSFMSYTRIKCKNNMPYNTHPSALSMNTGMCYTIMMDEWIGAGFIIGYNMIDHVFRPENICLDEWGLNYDESDKKGSLQNIFFGFSVYFDLAWKPETAE
ncbi:MAG: hypothetical protein HY841_13255 [Bacteroidetes bacterium]|nr:hypothetical protein [Bacteroidota bacterium]